MHKLRVKVKDESILIDISSDFSIKRLLDNSKFRVKSACNGIGGCGLCKVKILEGKVSNIKEAEKFHLSESELSDGVRLACQVFMDSSGEIEIINLAKNSNFKSILFHKKLNFYSDFDIDKNSYLLAVDIGTTNITFLLYSREKEIANRNILNPQSKYGTDVINRLLASSDKDVAKELQSLIIEIIKSALRDIVKRECIDINLISKIYIVGNSAMLSLLANKNQKELLSPKKWGSYIDVLPNSIDKWSEFLGVKAKIEVIKPIAGFIGSDIVAGIIYTNLLKQKNSLLIDFGTNSEIALFDGEKLFATSASGGPAFEGVGIHFGMSAEDGAIYEIDRDFSYRVINNEEPKGICGSGLIDLISILREKNIIDEIGNFKDEIKKWIIPNSDIYLTKSDIDLIQRAKSSIVAGVLILCKRANINLSELNRVYIAGAFGEYLNIKRAISIGLLPNIDENKFKIIGNSALGGTIDLMLFKSAKDNLSELFNRVEVLNLSKESDFELTFLENLFLNRVKS